MYSLFTSFVIITVINTILCRPEVTDSPTAIQASIQSIPPGVSIYHTDPKNGASFININPFLTNSLLQAIVEESEQKKRVQRYRDVKK